MSAPERRDHRMDDLEREVAAIVQRAFHGRSADKDAPQSIADLDSLVLVELIVTLEQKLDIRFGADQLNADTFKSVATLVSAVRTARAPG